MRGDEVVSLVLGVAAVFVAAALIVVRRRQQRRARAMLLELLRHAGRNDVDVRPLVPAIPAILLLRHPWQFRFAVRCVTDQSESERFVANVFSLGWRLGGEYRAVFWQPDGQPYPVDVSGGYSNIHSDPEGS